MGATTTTTVEKKSSKKTDEAANGKAARRNGHGRIADAARDSRDPSELVNQLKFTSLASVQSGLKRLRLSPEDSMNLAEAALAASPRKGRMVVHGIVHVLPNVKDIRNFVTDVNRSNDPVLRRETALAYKKAGKHLEFITAVSTLPTKATPDFMRDYFDAGGSLGDVVDWLAAMAQSKPLPKRARGGAHSNGRRAAKRRGFFSDLWDAITSVGQAIADAVSNIVNAVIELGKAIAEVIGEILARAQSEINQIIDALLDAGRAIFEFVVSAVQRGLDAAKKIFTALLAVGKTVGQILKALYDHAKAFIQTGLRALLAIGRTLVQILDAAIALGTSILQEFVKGLIAIGQALVNILNWVASKAANIMQAVFEALLSIGTALASLINWIVTQAFAIVKKAFQVLFALGETVAVIIATLVTHPKDLLKNAVKALMELGATFYDFLHTVAMSTISILQKVVEVLVEIAGTVEQLFEFAIQQTAKIARELFELLLKAGLAVFNLILWAVNKAFEVFSFVMSVVDGFFKVLGEIVEWAVSLGGPVLQKIAQWISDKIASGVDWFKNKVIVPLLAVGKLGVVIVLAGLSIVLLAASYFVLKSVVDVNKTDFKTWPATLAQFKAQFAGKLINLPDVDAAHKYVLVSDAHIESQKDIDGGIGHFFKNEAIFKNVLDYYASDPAWTLLMIGDEHEFWYSNDLGEFESPNKVDSIINAHPQVYGKLSADFYNQTPRRFIKMRGNHDSIYRSAAAVNKYRARGFPNIQVYDYATVKRDGRDILIMHGQQFDPYNCEANESFGKFASNFAAEPLDALNETLVSLFGQGARIEGRMFTPYYTRTEWEISDNGGPPILAETEDPDIDTDLLFDEAPIADKIRSFGCSIIIGHTHEPKIMKDSQDFNRFYANIGTAGWWEGAVWTLEIMPDDVTLNLWTNDSVSAPHRTLRLSQVGQSAFF